MKSFLQDIQQIKFFLLVQLIVLGVSAYFEFVPFFVLLGLTIASILSYKIFINPIWFNVIVILAFLIDVIFPIEAKFAGIPLLIVEPLILILLPVVFIRLFFDLNSIDKIDNKILIWLPFLIWALVIGLVVGVDKHRIISFWKNFFIGFVMFSVIIVFLRDSESFKTILRIIIIWAIILAILMIKVIIDAGGLVSGIMGLLIYKNLLDVGWGQSNYLAAFYVIIIPLTIGYLIYSKNIFNKYLLTLALIFMFLAITLTLSRGGILALLITLFIFLSRLIKLKYLLSIFISLSLITLILLLNPITYVIIERISTFDTSLSVYTRINFYEDVWETFLNYPLTGVGLGNLGYYSKFILGPGISPSAHNIVLGALGELGIFGSIFYLSIFVIIGYQMFLLYRKETDESLKILRWSLLSSFLGGLIHTLVEPTLEMLQFSTIFWSITALSFKIDLLRKK